MGDFVIVNNNKSPPKRRLVFDAAAKVNDISLNSQLLAGPNLVPPLVDILYNFRVKPFAVTADIREMFHQVKIRAEDQQSQRILWRYCNQNTKPDIFIMQVMTFGSACSPVCAAMVKNQNALKYIEKYPEAVDAILNRHYVDDLIISFDNIEEAVLVCSQVVAIHREASFELRNFKSNEAEIIKELPSNCEVSKSINFSKATEDKTLGLYWDTCNDQFFFKVSCLNLPFDILQKQRNITKREALSFVMEIFDPLGFIGIITIRGKLIIQEIWSSKFEWDESISDDLNNKFMKWVEELMNVNNIRIQRCHFKNINTEREVELHILVDASEKAYCAVAYFKIIQPEIKLSLIGSKTKVTPLKKPSTPRRELTAAVIGVRYANSIIKAYEDFSIKRKYFWTDSTVVLAWLNAPNKKREQYVSSRVSEILEKSNVKDWQHISSVENVADDATKNKGNVKNESRWFTGPRHLLLPNIDQQFEMSYEMEEELLAVNIKSNISFSFIEVQKFSNWEKLVRTVAYVLRFIKSKIYKQKPIQRYLNVDELREAENLLIRKAQFESFENEYFQLLEEELLPKQSKLFMLSPQLHEDGIIRINGRLNKSNLLPETKQPMILPKTSYVTFLIAKLYHEKFQHYNQEAIIANIRKRFWVIGCRSVVRSVKSKCQICKNKAAKPQTPIMGQIPEYKFAAYRKPFTYTGVDLFGPFEVQVTKRLIEKRYGAIFVCMTSGAVHIELVADLSSDAFLRVLRNFINRRGPVTRFISDNGTNFHAAVKEINSSVNELGEMAAGHRIEWDFIPPRSPNFGGQLERLIQSIKKVLCHLLTSSRPKEDVLRSSLIEVENVINARPLTHVPIDPFNTEPITPNDIIKGMPHPAMSPGVFGEHEYKYRRQWRIAQQFANSFWKRWTENYLPELVRRPKWCSPVKQIEVGDVVLIIDSSERRSHYKKGIVTQLYPGEDGVVRVAKVKTETRELKRPVSKLAVLDLKN